MKLVRLRVVQAGTDLRAKVVQDRVVQDRVVQDRVVQDRVVQDRVVQDRVDPDSEALDLVALVEVDRRHLVLRLECKGRRMAIAPWDRPPRMDRLKVRANKANVPVRRDKDHKALAATILKVRKVRESARPEAPKEMMDHRHGVKDLQVKGRLHVIHHRVKQRPNRVLSTLKPWDCSPTASRN
jgi:hypothetical protein